MELERLHLDEESFNQPWIALRYSVLLPHKWEPYISYRFAHSKYKEKEWLFDAKRSDRKHDFGVGVKKTFWESRDRRRSLDAEASYRYTRNYSNMDLYDYKRHAIDFSVGFSF